MARSHSLVPPAARIVTVAVSLVVLDAAVPDLGRWWRLLIAVLIALLVGFLAERVLRRDRPSREAQGRPPR